MVIDPYDPENVGYKLPKLEAEVLLITHDHADHNYRQGVAGYRLLVEGLGEYETKGVTIYGIESCHDNKNGEERGNNTMYLLEVDGVNILHMGDLGHDLSTETMEKIPQVDVLIIPVGGKCTIDAEAASELISDIEPGIVIPMHYQTDDLKGLALDKLDVFLKEMGVEGKTKHEEKLKLSNKNDIPEDTTVVILEPQH